MIATVVVRGVFRACTGLDNVYTISVIRTDQIEEANYAPLFAVTCESNLKQGHSYQVTLPSPYSCQSLYERNQYPVITILQEPNANI